VMGANAFVRQPAIRPSAMGLRASSELVANLEPNRSYYRCADVRLMASSLLSLPDSSSTSHSWHRRWRSGQWFSACRSLLEHMMTGIFGRECDV